MSNANTVVFVDGANLYGTSKALGFDTDYKKLKDYFGDSLLRIYYYTAVLEDDSGGTPLEHVPIIPLLDWLSYNGYCVKKKAAKHFTGADGRAKVKGNMDMEMAIDALELSGTIKNMWLFTGDGDFSYLVEALQRRAVHVTVCSSIKTSPPMCADELRRISDVFVDISDMNVRSDGTKRKSKYA